MKRLLGLGLLVGVAALALPACAHDATKGGHGRHADGTACEGCTVGKSGGTMWCDACNAGFVNGKKTHCKGCVDAAKSGTACAACASK